MTVHVNGTEQQVDPGTTLKDLLVALDLDRDGIAVAVDRQVVPKTEHASRVLTDGATIEVIRAVGGG